MHCQGSIGIGAGAAALLRWLALGHIVTDEWSSIQGLAFIPMLTPEDTNVRDPWPRMNGIISYDTYSYNMLLGLHRSKLFASEETVGH